MGDEPRGVLNVELNLDRRVKVTIPLDTDQVRDYLEAGDREEWIDEFLESNGEHPLIERAVLEAYDIYAAAYAGLDSTESLPPRVHKDQLTIDALT